MMDQDKSMTYAGAGVDIDAGNEAVQRIKGAVATTMRDGVLSGLGGFAGLFELSSGQYQKPVLVSGCDGVGTKLKLAFALDKHDTIGIDCVAMCVNDILVQGAEPLFFLDYLAVAEVVPEQIEQIVNGLARGCRLAGAALLGGETAEMPDFYRPGEYDLAGFAVGIVDREDIIDGSTIEPGDAIIGLASSGLHSNGFSLVRKVLLQRAGLSLDQPVGDMDHSLGEELLKPTRIYVSAITELKKNVNIKGMAHITGGGLVHNISRVLPAGCAGSIDAGAWPVPPVFDLIRRRGPVTETEMLSTFNLGVGFVLIVSPEAVGQALKTLTDCGEQAYEIGCIEPGQGTVTVGGKVFV